MGKPRRRKEGKVLVTKARRSYSAYNASNYLIPTGLDSPAGEDSSLWKTNGECDDADSDKEDDEGGGGAPASAGARSSGEDTLINKHTLYQRAVQKPKGDISYLQKFFLNYIGGRTPLHLREDFCGTALICAEWVRGDTRRTAVGLDLDEEALRWGLQHNVVGAGSDVYNRVHLFCGDVINPLSKAPRIEADPSTLDLIKGAVTEEEEEEDRSEMEEIEGSKKEDAAKEPNPTHLPRDTPGADIICAFNYSCCCLQKRADLVKYFSQAFKTLSKDGGIFAMDLYGGTSSECSLKLRRRFDEFQYTWEQEDFDVITRTTRISLHFRLNKNQGVLRHAFSYHWRLWTLPEVKECLEEAGFQSVHFWVREMPDLQGRHGDESIGSDTKSKYEEVDSFLQEDAWNAYVVAVAPPKLAGGKKI